MTILVNTQELEAKVKDMYRHVAQQPQDRFHFELGAPVALRAGYDSDRLADVPRSGGVLRRGGPLLRPGRPADRRVRGRPRQWLRDGRLLRGRARRPHRPRLRGGLHPGAARQGPSARHRRRSRAGGVPRSTHRSPPSGRCQRRLRDLQRRDQPMSRQAGRLRRGGAGPQARWAPGNRRHHQRAAAQGRHRLQRRLWASCIGGAAQQELDLQAIESAGFTILAHRVNPYEFISDQARDASAKYGVKSISVLATKTEH